MFTRLLFVIGLVVSAAFAKAQEGYAIIDTRQGKEVSVAELGAAAAKVDVVFFGEEHTDSLAHVLQLAVFEELISRKGGKVALSMEMFHTDVQFILDEYLLGLIPEELFQNDARAWPNYETDYKPLVERAKEKELPVIAANAPRRYVRKVSREGQAALLALPKASKQYLPKLPYESLDGRYREKFTNLMGGMHDGVSESFFDSQNLWDATMAHSIHRYWKKNKKSTVLHLCGRFHSDERLGTVEHLQLNSKRIDSLVITCLGIDAEELAFPEQFKNLADYVIIRK